MRKISLLMLTAVLGMSAAGCMSPSKSMTDSFDKAAQSYYGQARVDKVFYAKGTGMNISFTNMDEFYINSPVSPLSIIPKDPSTAGKLVDAAESVARIGLAAYAGERIVSHLSDRPTVVNPTVVEQPKPVIVETRR